MDALTELGALLRPAGMGVHLVSTGRNEQLELARRLYRAQDERGVQSAFERTLETVRQARGVVLGVPSDVGAGYRRGSNVAPMALRQALLDEDSDWPARAAELGIVDVGDVPCVPQLLLDEMCSAAQLDASRRALYPTLPASSREGLPVAPLSIAERALQRIAELNPRAVPIVLGGDHSVAWPVARVLARTHPDFGIVQPDAHTDLLEERLGVRICFATWSRHAASLLRRPDRLVQVGVRASRHDRAYWEAHTGVRQFWADQCLSDPNAALDAIVSHLRETGARGVYFSNDIDGTDPAFAASTGTPEPGGLTPPFVETLVRRLGHEIGLVAADLVEVAPPLGPTPEQTARTLRTATGYLRATLDAIVRGRTP
ncbi:MAG: arginase family protein [Myxococcota bacterium]|nr:arginase family protein [Myxococcota bacterium]MDW8361047.1 arginase family protein [Myxococcales bacterium]